MTTSKKRNPEKWTLVQHSGAGYAGKPAFAQAVETRHIGNKDDGNPMTAKQFEKEIKRITDAGGLLFDSYGEASDAEDKINGIYGGDFLNAKGTFSHEMVDGLYIYQPPKVIA